MITEKVATARNGLATASLVLGILAFTPGFGFLFGIAAIITGIIALNQVKKQATKGQGFAITGIVLGCVPFVMILILTLMGPMVRDIFNTINASL